MIVNFPTKLPNKFFHFFVAEDGEIFRVECNEQEYRALGLKGAGAPPTPKLPVGKKWKWQHSGEYGQWDTASGNLEKGDADIDLKGNIAFVEPSGKTKILLSGKYDLIGDNLTPK